MQAATAAPTNTMSLRRATRLRCGLKPMGTVCLLADAGAKAVLGSVATMRAVRVVNLCFMGGVVGGLLWIAGASSAAATAPPDDSTTTTLVTDAPLPPAPPTAQGPLIQSPPGCVVPAPPLAVFRGRAINIDDPPTTAQFRVLSMLSGSLDGHASIDRVLVVYGREASFLEIGVEYIVGVRLDLDTGRLVSKILRPAPLFGGDAVIGIEDTTIECPRLEDPISTLLSSGSSVDSGVLTPLQDSSSSLVAAIVQPLAIALAVLVALVLVKELLVSMGRSLRESIGPTMPLARDRHHAKVPTASPASDVGDQGLP